MPQEQLCALPALHAGESGVLRRVGIADARVLRYLSRLDLEPGRTLRLVDVAPFNGPVTIEISGANNGAGVASTQIVGHELAAQLFVIQPHRTRPEE